LLIQGRKDEFLKARPDYKQWSIFQKQENSSMEQHYFSHPAYDNFPVVNVSREGAEMYCVWLTKEIINTVEDKKKSQYNDVRIPVREEWVMAASSGGTKYPYPWGEQPDRLIKDAQVYATYAQEKNTLNEIANKQDVTTSVIAYLPNDFGLYNMSGNVAEMVYDDIKLKTAGTAGGGWMSTADEIKILAPDTYSGIVLPNVCIGFRVVMTVKKQM
jgi:formylglycine-generating enzyme required for sulfatase activity